MELTKPLVNDQVLHPHVLGHVPLLSFLTSNL
jgi:hypothetical protein